MSLRITGCGTQAAALPPQGGSFGVREVWLSGFQGVTNYKSPLKVTEIIPTLLQTGGKQRLLSGFAPRTGSA